MHRIHPVRLFALLILVSAAGCSGDGAIIVPGACEDGAKRCQNSIFSTCVEGVWVTEQNCENGCNAAETACQTPEASEGCQNGTTRCVHNIEMACLEGAWEQTRTCPDGCDDAEAKCLESGDVVDPNTCHEGETRQENGITLICVDGLWQPQDCEDCETAACEHEGALCLDGWIVTCQDGHVTSKKVCENGCHDGESVCATVESTPECQEGTQKCTSDKLYTCKEGVWQVDMTCTHGCHADGTSCAECKAGESTCSDGIQKLCTGDTWQSVPCPYGCGVDGKTCESINQMQPTRYLDGSGLHSPITPYVAEQMRAIAAKNTSRKTDVFIKVGDSHYDKEFDGRFMLCFSDDTSAKVTLDGRTELESVIEAFQSDRDSFNRDSYAAVGGSSTRNLFQVTPDNITKEINDMSPRFAFFGHGCNDMGNGCYAHESSGCNGYAWALQDYYRQVNKAMDIMINAGVIPLISAIAPRNDAPAKVSYMDGAANIPSTSDYPKYMSRTFNAVARGNAEARQLPYFDTFHAFIDLPDRGISSDKLHASHSGSPCNFASDGLQYGVNTRNLGSIQLLDRAWQVIGKGKDAPDRVTEPFIGSGSSADPFVINSLPYTHSGDTSKSANSQIASYPGCSTAKEGGGEYIYQMELTSDKRLRVFAVSATGVDVDIQVMRGNIDGNACIARDDIMLHGKFKAGTYYIAVDTYSGSTAKPGLYLLGIVECDPEDKYCDTPL